VSWRPEESAFLLINKFFSENPKNVLLIDKRVYNLYRDKFTIDQKQIFTVEATEKAKTLQGVMKVIDFLQGQNFSKAETLVVVGGGVVQDIGAFVGVVFKRGIPWVFFPTTLLAMCDSCIGGKTGINYKSAKNQLALFSAPRQVIICPQFLQSLPEQEIKAGLGEILKLHVIGGAEMVKRYELLVERGKVKTRENFQPLILGALIVKRAVIEADEFDINLRRSMNYGHTFGHAVEGLTNFTISHGQAVALGMIIVNEISVHRSLLPPKEKNRVQKLCLDLLDTKVSSRILDLPSNRLKILLLKDKKTTGDTINLVVLRHLGETIFLPLPLNETLLEEAHQIIASVFK